mmetsp:Transcript_2700/g.5783  ORF Transcript_2700/g.5783 Transcript_2700/m.5783 type:complete len:107 (+) Transcript_2700:808-1128(+)
MTVVAAVVMPMGSTGTFSRTSTAYRRASYKGSKRKVTEDATTTITMALMPLRRNPEESGLGDFAARAGATDLATTALAPPFSSLRGHSVYGNLFLSSFQELALTWL